MIGKIKIHEVTNPHFRYSTSGIFRGPNQLRHVFFCSERQYT